MRKVAISRIVSILLLNLSLTGVALGDSSEVMMPEFYIKKNKTEVREMLREVNALTVGTTTKEAARKRLGPGDSEVISYGPKGVVMSKKGTISTYYLEKQDEGMVNERTDRYILLLFDNEGILRKIIKKGASLSDEQGK